MSEKDNKQKAQDRLKAYRERHADDDDAAFIEVKALVDHLNSEARRQEGRRQ